MTARLVPEAFAELSLTGKTVTAEDVLANPANARRLKDALATLIGVLQQI